LELQIEVRQVWISLVVGYFLYLISGYTLVPVTFFVLSFGLLEEIEDMDEEEQEESEYDEDAFINDTFCEFKLDFFDFQFEQASKKGNIDKRFLDNGFVFDVAKSFDFELSKALRGNGIGVDTDDPIYLYILFAPLTSSFLDEQEFSLREDLEEGKDEDEVNAFYRKVFDNSVHNFFDIGLDEFRDKLRVKFDFEFSVKFCSFYEKNKSIFLKYFGKPKLSKLSGLSKKPEFLYRQDFFFNYGGNKHYLDNVILKLYENNILKMKYPKKKNYRNDLDYSLFEWVSYKEPKLSRSSIRDVHLERAFGADITNGYYYEEYVALIG
jgi:hypothetical protein